MFDNICTCNTQNQLIQKKTKNVAYKIDTCTFFNFFLFLLKMIFFVCMKFQAIFANTMYL
jgi:hypothetical protein